ncbi:MAG: RluA family pseudouridine synthase [Bacteroidales bacterium]|nr:RluA family pseudouridine synthase [Bacteroidales bacterium]
MKKGNKPCRNHRPDHIEVYNPTEATTLLPFLLQVLAPRSRTEVKSILAHSHVKVNGTATTQFDQPLAPGDEVLINFTHPFLTLNSRMVRLMYEDPDIVVIEKQSGLLTVPAGQTREKTAQKIVDDYLYASDGHSHAYVCHRLDQYTSGILIFAKNSQVQQMFRDSWTSYVVERRYLAVCEGVPADPEGEVRSYLAENSAMKVYSTDDPEKGKLSVTRYKVLKTHGDYSQVDIQLLTGRKNQIRVHMSDLGCPIAGDRKYGAKTNPIGRLMLHNYVLQFFHPITRENLRFELPIPKNFEL